MNQAKYVARPLNALNRVLGSVDAVRSSRVVYALLASFVRQRRMKLSGEYRPCYRLVT